MKKVLFLTSAIGIALCMQAQRTETFVSAIQPVDMLAQGASMKGGEVKVPNKFAKSQFDASLGIIENPQGEKKEMEKRTGYVDSTEEKVVSDNRFPATVVYGVDDEVYLRYSVTYGPSLTYIKGKRSGKDVRFDFPQVVYQDADYVYYATKVVQPVAGYLLQYDMAPAGENYVVYHMGDDGSLTLDLGSEIDPESPAALLSLVTVGNGQKLEDGYYWYGVGDFSQKYITPTLNDPLIPETLEWQQWVYHDIYSGNTWCRMAFDDKHVYIKDLFYYNREECLVGDIEGNKVTFKSQYIGIDKNRNFYKWITLMDASDELYDSYEYAYDREEKTLLPTGPYVRMYFTYEENQRGQQFANHPMFIYLNPETANPKPLNPRLMDYKAWREIAPGYGFGGYQWEAQPITVEGMPLTPQNTVYANLYLDGEKFYADPETYGCEEPMFDIPNGFIGHEADLTYFENYIVLRIMEPFELHEKVGCQTWYYDKNGDKQMSDLVETEIEGSGVEVIATDGREVSGIKYFDLSGQRVFNPGKGVYVRVVDFADGTSKREKVVK